MKKFLIILIFYSNLLYSQSLRDSVFFQNHIFTAMYSETLQQPLWVKYSVLCPSGNISRSGLDFHRENSIVTSDNLDYVNNIWDKGHLAPAADFNCTKEMLFETFTYVNCSLQHQDLNRGVWKQLEEAERNLAKKYKEVKVTIIVYYPTPIKRIPSGAAIPLGFYKEITYNNTTDCYYFPNISPIKKNYMDYKCDCKNIIK